MSTYLRFKRGDKISPSQKYGCFGGVGHVPSGTEEIILDQPVDVRSMYGDPRYHDMARPKEADEVKNLYLESLHASGIGELMTSHPKTLEEWRDGVKPAARATLHPRILVGILEAYRSVAMNRVPWYHPIRVVDEYVKPGIAALLVSRILRGGNARQSIAYVSGDCFPALWTENMFPFFDEKRLLSYCPNKDHTYRGSPGDFWGLSKTFAGVLTKSTDKFVWSGRTSKDLPVVEYNQELVEKYKAYNPVLTYRDVGGNLYSAAVPIDDFPKDAQKEIILHLVDMLEEAGA